MRKGFAGTGRFLDQNQSKQFREMVGCLLYISGACRPDIAFAVGRLAQFSHLPCEDCMKAAKQVISYLLSTKDLGLMYKDEGDILKHGLIATGRPAQPQGGAQQDMF